MANAKDIAAEDVHRRILLVGPTGSGKTSQIWTLPGKKFCYVFDPNALSSLRGCDVEYELFLPDIMSMDMTLKGFNKGSRSDRPKKPVEPTIFNRWAEDFNKRYDEGFFSGFDWLIFDSATFVSKAIMDRQLFINGRYGDVEDIADYKVVGAKVADIFANISGMKINIFMTGHLSTYQDEKTQKIMTQINLPGRARNLVPLHFTDIWLAQASGDAKGGKYEVRTIAEARGLQDIRCSLKGLQALEEVTIKDFRNPTQYGVGALLQKATKRN